MVMRAMRSTNFVIYFEWKKNYDLFRAKLGPINRTRNRR